MCDRQFPNCIGRNADMAGEHTFYGCPKSMPRTFIQSHTKRHGCYSFFMFTIPTTHFPLLSGSCPVIHDYPVPFYQTKCHSSFCVTIVILFFRKGKPPLPSLPMPGYAASDCGKSSSPLSSVFSASALSVCHRHLWISRKINPHGHRKTEMREEKKHFSNKVKYELRQEKITHG